ncbi:MAG: ATP-binding cassette domain-containing protein [Spirochaetes bacterium]|nr:ATP-binding cassette domain-containing protein [Spirochaetota bacterium]
MANIHLEMRNISKAFYGVMALDSVDLTVNNHEIHAIVGENGAGKSTLMKVLSGVHADGSFDGEIFFNGNKCTFSGIKDSEKYGIVIIHQELALVPYLSIAENIFLGNERAKNGIIDWNNSISEANKLLEKVGLNEKSTTLVENIGVGKQQLVEIAKALSKDVKLLILDEPTAALNDEESNKLLNLLLELKKQGITSILISHKLNEIEKVADAITVIRDGKVIDNLHKSTDKIDEDRIIRSMVGREITDRFPSRKSNIGEETFKVENWTVYDPQHHDKKAIDNINFNVKKGEVVGFAGLMGAGRTEIAMSIFGKSWGVRHSGKIYKDNKEIFIHSVNDAIKQGLAYVTEDRKSYGLVLINNIMRNLTLSSLKSISNSGVINSNEEVITSQNFREKLNIKCSGLEQKVEDLSGGNQQKVVLGKWIMAEPDILILDEPTRGIDVGAKYEIYTIINSLVAEGKSVIMISSEMPELLGMCDRIYVITEGRVAGELKGKEATQESIMKCIITHQRERSI